MAMVPPTPLSYVKENSEAYLQYTEFNHSPIHRNRLACIIHMIQQSSTDPLSILEIGCGLGNIAIPVASLGHKVTAIDVHGPSLEDAAKRNPFPNLTLKQQPLEEMDIGTFDAVILTEVLEHVPEHKKMLKHIRNGMRDDARLMLTVPNGWGLAEMACRPSYILKRTHMGSKLVEKIKGALASGDLTTANLQTPHVHFFTLGALNRLFEQTGLEVKLFHRFFFSWALRTTLFPKFGLPEESAEKDFLKSQKIPAGVCAFWAFLLEKKRS